MKKLTKEQIKKIAEAANSSEESREELKKIMSKYKPFPPVMIENKSCVAIAEEHAHIVHGLS